MSTSLQEIQNLIDTDRKKEARQKLKTILQTAPSADGWYMTALVVDNEAQKIKCLRQALKIDEMHSPANRLLYQIEGSIPQQEREKLKRHQEKLKTKEIVPLEKIDREMKQDRFQKQKQRQRSRTRYGCLFSLMLSASCSMFAFSAIGMLPGFIATVTGIFGGPAPVYEVDGIPIQDVKDAIFILPPSQSNDATNQEVDIMDHGFLHEYVFTARAGTTYAIYVQFMSLSANSVSKNVVVTDEQDFDVTYLCEQQRIIEGNQGVAYVCTATTSGEWSVRILGVTGESVGAYFVGVESLAY